MSNPKDKSIMIVGVGVFGLSTALHLLESGYKNVTIFNSQNFLETKYSPFLGADSASPDTMKVVSPGLQIRKFPHNLNLLHHPRLEILERCFPVPLFINCGWNRMPFPSLPQSEIETQKLLKENGQGASQYRISDPGERKRARKDEWGGWNLDPFGRVEWGKVDGVLDMLAGFVLCG